MSKLHIEGEISKYSTSLDDDEIATMKRILSLPSTSIVARFGTHKYCIPWTWRNGARVIFGEVSSMPGLVDFFVKQFGITKWDLFWELHQYAPVWQENSTILQSVKLELATELVV